MKHGDMTLVSATLALCVLLAYCLICQHTDARCRYSNSVRLSVTFLYSIETVEPIVVVSSPHASPIIIIL